MKGSFISRSLKESIQQRIGTGKAIVVLGPRQTGKTTLLKQILASKESYLFLDGDDPILRQQIENANTESLRKIIGDNRYIFIDEAQRIKNIGLALKIIIDQLKPYQLFVSGSSALEISSEINEPLTGRKWEYTLYPISWEEIINHTNYIQAYQSLEQRLIFGSYPAVVTQSGNEEELLKELTDSYLYKDLLSYKGIRKPEILNKLLRALAFQVGNEVSYNELSRLVQIDKNTIQTYIDLLEKAYVIYRLQPLSRNLRNEINSSRKIYFYDNGIRNALISNFNSLEFRNDIGALWENFLITERRKLLENKRTFANSYFWRTIRQQEIDYIEEANGLLTAYEFKWNPQKNVRFPKSFNEGYPDAITKLIHKDNFDEFILGSM